MIRGSQNSEMKMLISINTIPFLRNGIDFLASRVLKAVKFLPHPFHDFLCDRWFLKYPLYRKNCIQLLLFLRKISKCSQNPIESLSLFIQLIFLKKKRVPKICVKFTKNCYKTTKYLIFAEKKYSNRKNANYARNAV